jgi:hypothetical protein
MRNNYRAANPRHQPFLSATAGSTCSPSRRTAARRAAPVGPATGALSVVPGVIAASSKSANARAARELTIEATIQL